METGPTGSLGGPLFYAGLWLALALWGAVVIRARGLSPRTAIAAVVAVHIVFLLAPPLLSQDVFSYIAYARLGVEHDLNPYEHAPDAVPGDAVYPYAGSKTATSAYGPLFTLVTYPLAGLGVPTAYWILKVLAALASLALVAVVWRTAEQLGRDPVAPALFVGMNPLTLVHVVGGAHNEAYVVLLTMVGVLAWASGREAAAGACVHARRRDQGIGRAGGPVPDRRGAGAARGGGRGRGRDRDRGGRVCGLRR